jgi:hypothetical protein
MSDIALKDIKNDLYRFLDDHSKALNIYNLQFSRESGAALNRSLTWYDRNENIEAADAVSAGGSYIDYFNFCLEKHFYSLQMVDGSMLQIEMRSNDDGKLDGGSLAFIPRPENGFDYFRFDYEPRDARHFRHNRYHIHFGFHAKNMRISAYQFPWPSEFISFIAHLMSDKKGRAVVGSDFQVDVEITAFHYDHLLRSLEACGEKFNHCFRFHHAPHGGTRNKALKSDSWQEEILQHLPCRLVRLLAIVKNNGYNVRLQDVRSRQTF